MHHADLQNTYTMFDGVYLAVIQSRQWMQLAFRGRLLRNNPNRDFEKLFPYNASVSSNVRMWLWRILTRVYHCVLVNIGQIWFEGSLIRISMNRTTPMMKALVLLCIWNVET
jgi:hypothetical protein